MIFVNHVDHMSIFNHSMIIVAVCLNNKKKKTLG